MSNLIKYDAAIQALAECRAVDEVKSWADKSAAMQAYGRMAKDKTLEVDAAEIRIRSERRLGELIAQQKAGEGLAKPGPKPSSNSVVANDRSPVPPKLADVGISKDLSSRAQKLAAVPAADFEAEVGEWRERVTQEGERVSARLEARGEAAMRTAPENKQAPPDDDGPSLEELVDELQSENARLTAEIQAAEADDLAAEAIKWRRCYEQSLRQQSDAMEKAARSEKREKWTMNQLRRCGKAVGEEDPKKIARAVEVAATKQAMAT